MTEPPKTPACRDCRFFVFHGDTVGDGECRRYAPRSKFDNKGSELRAVEWPGVSGPRDWCGEFSAKDVQRLAVPGTVDAELLVRTWRVSMGAIGPVTFREVDAMRMALRMQLNVAVR